MAFKDTPNGIVITRFQYSKKPANHVRRPCRQIVDVLVRLSGFYNKTYAFPSQDKILALLKRWYGVAMSRRTLNRHLNTLCKQMLLTRKRRHQYHRRKGMLIRSTLYSALSRHWATKTRELNAEIKTAHAHLASLSNSRVPGVAQYIKSYIKILLSAATYPQFLPPKPS